MPEPRVLDVLRRTWGYDSLRPLQERAIEAALARRDSLVVMPTGGGKSLCYQLPPLLTGDLTVVVSPLISLMKDQVDTLRDLGVDARELNSTTTEVHKRDLVRAARERKLRLLFVSPERMAAEKFVDFLKTLDVRTFAIDEAHCISHWGHDFRPEYRQLGALRNQFPNAALHAYTATATESVRRDIAGQLRLKEPAILVGSFDRPNLSYRILPRVEPLKQTLETIERHTGEAGIIYCIRKKDVDELTAALRKRGIDARPYHAGLTKQERSATQDAFAAEECNIVVATVAFGMGIDRSNIRFVLHTGLPKSIEHYQQETGRAGRDGLEADCVLLYSGADVLLWRSIVEQSTPHMLKHIQEMDRYARGAVCRHRALVQYFGEEYVTPNCGACDLCLGDVEEVDDATVIAQKILSCVVRVEQRFGIGHVISVLRGEGVERVRRLGHDRLSTYGLLSAHGQSELRDWIYQLIGHGLLEQDGDRYPVLKLTDAARPVLRGEENVRLVQIARKQQRRKFERDSWEGVDNALFESLRKFRRELAAARGVPPYIILGDRSLREVARLRPQTLTQLGAVYGIGEKKLADLGERILAIVSVTGGHKADTQSRSSS